MNFPSFARMHQATLITCILGTATMTVGAQSMPLAPLSPVAEVRVPEAEPMAQMAAQPASANAGAPKAATEAAEPEWKPALKVGEATQGLLALQSSGISASAVQRPITGDMAARSYPRYLKSFEFPIPQTFNATIKNAGTSNSQ